MFNKLVYQNSLNIPLLILNFVWKVIWGRSSMKTFTNNNAWLTVFVEWTGEWWLIERLPANNLGMRTCRFCSSHCGVQKLWRQQCLRLAVYYVWLMLCVLTLLTLLTTDVSELSLIAFVLTSVLTTTTITKINSLEIETL